MHAAKRYLHSAITRIARLDRSVLELSGPDAQKFLKGLTCRDVDVLGGGYSGFLNASGRVLHAVFIIPSPGPIPTYLITHQSPPSHPAPLQDLLPPFKLRSKVKIRDVTDAWSVYATWDDVVTGAHRSWKFGSGGAAEATWTWDSMQDLGLNDGELGCWDLRAGIGRHILVPKEREIGSRTDDYHLHRYRQGIPEGDEIVPGQALPMESCMDIHGGVDFRKGCYLGQELTVRTYHTGATRKRILPITLFPLTNLDRPVSSLSSDNTDVPPGPSDIMYYPPPSATSQKPRSAGRILARHPVVSGVGLGLVRLEMAEKLWNGDGSASIRDWLGTRGQLKTTINGEEWGVIVSKGEAWAAASAAKDAL